jgi:hypothetical protein
MTKLTTDNVVEELVKRVPELKPLYQEEIDYYGDIASYIFFGPILCEFVCKHIDESGNLSSSNKAILMPIFVLVEECVETEDKDLRELILAGFLESFIPTMNDYPVLKSLLGDQTEQLLSFFE